MNKRRKMIFGGVCLALTVLLVGAGALIALAAPANLGDQPLPEAVTINGIEVSLTDYQFKDATLQVDLCFDIPSDADWVPYDLALQAGDKIASFTDYALLGIETDAKGVSVRRCDRASLTLPEDVHGSLALVLPRLFAYPRSEAADCAAIQKNLDAYAIKITCQTPTDVGMGGFRWEIVEKPAGMSDTEVQRIVHDASLAGTVTGPWQFEVVVP